MSRKFAIYSDGKKVEGTLFLKHFQEEEEIGLFESLRTYEGHKVFRLKQHLQRLRESAHTIQYRFPFNTAVIERQLRKGIRDFLKEHGPDLGTDKPELFLRISLWQGKTFIMVGQKKHPQAIYQTGVRLKTSPVKRTLSNAMPSQVKTSAYHNAFMASLEVMPENTYEWVFLDRHGWVTEVRIGNLFIVKHGCVLTPPEQGILNGVTRGVVIESCFRNGLTVKETPLTRHEIYNADEAFLTNTSWEILPVSALDGREIGSVIPGTVTQRLQKTFKQIVREETL